MQLVLCVDSLWGIQKVLAKLVAEVNGDFIETAHVVAELGKVLIDVLPLGVLLVCQFLEVGKEIAFHILLVEEIITLIDDSLEATAAYRFSPFSKALVIFLT